MSGSLFKNEEKQKDNHPDYEGSAVIDGVAYWLSGWIKRPEGKKSFMSLSFKPKQERRKEQREQPKQAPKQKEETYEEMKKRPDIEF